MLWEYNFHDDFIYCEGFAIFSGSRYADIDMICLIYYASKRYILYILSIYVDRLSDIKALNLGVFYIEAYYAKKYDILPPKKLLIFCARSRFYFFEV